MGPDVTYGKFQTAQCLKKEKTRGKIYNTREELKAEIFDYIEVFYNRVRRHSYLNYLSPVQFEQQQIGH